MDVKEGASSLLKWFQGNQTNGFATMEGFDKEYLRLFGVPPKWYSWEYFYRDHGCVGLVSAKSRPEARPLEDRNPGADSERVSSFATKMLNKWWKGRQEHGTVVRIDPLEEALDECLDIANYAMEQYYRIETLRERLGGLKIHD